MDRDEAKVLGAFRARYAYDRGLDRLKALEHYQRLFAGYEDGVAGEYAGSGARDWEVKADLAFLRELHLVERHGWGRGAYWVLGSAKDAS